MKTIYLRHLISAASVITAGIAFAPSAAFSQNAIQSCSSNEQCQLVAPSCNDSCAYVPMSTANIPAFGAAYQQRCGKAMTTAPACVMNPPMNAACINNRCTIDYAYANNSGPKDYKAGTGKSAGGKVTAKTGTAYDLPGGAAQQNTMNSGGAVPPAAQPTQASKATPPEPVPSQVAPAPQPRAATSGDAGSPYQTQQPSAASAATPPRAAATGQKSYQGMAGQQAPQGRALTDPEGNRVPTGDVPNPVQGAPKEYVPASTLPAPDQTTARAVKASGGERSNFGPTNTIIPADGTPSARPQAPAGSVPIPPSDLKPAPTFVPPPGAAIPVSPEDPGAPPPPGTKLIQPEDGKLGITTTTGVKTTSQGMTKTGTSTVYSGTAVNQ